MRNTSLLLTVTVIAASSLAAFSQIVQPDHIRIQFDNFAPEETGPIVFQFDSDAAEETAQVLMIPDESSNESAVPKSNPADLCTFEGIVLKSTTGEPARKISVTLVQVSGRVNDRRQDPYMATTDSAGRFAIGNVEPGKYMLSAGGGGYPFETYGGGSARRRGKVFTLERASHTKDVVFKLDPGGVISGAVYDEDGDPIIGASVQAVRASGRMMGQMGNAQTDDRGAYRIFGLANGHYYVVANEQNGNPQMQDEVYPPTYYPGTVDSGQATTVEVRPGNETSAIDLSMVRVHGVHIRGHVLNEYVGKPQGMYVQLMPISTKDARLGFRNYGAQTQDEHGGFDIRGVPPGSYVLFSYWNDEKRSLSGRVPLEVSNTDIDGVALVLNPPIELRGRVQTDAGAQLNFAQLNIWLQPTENSVNGVSPAEVKSDGTFVIRNVFDGHYKVVVGGHPEEYYLRSVKLGGADALTSGFTISHAQAAGLLELDLSLNGGSISGTVLQDGNPVPRALVTLVPDPPNRDRFEMYGFKIADDLGRFRMLGLPPGDFKVFAWESPQGDVHDPDFLKPYEKRGTAVHIQEKQGQNVQLEVIPADEEQ